eukprot:scaffold30494_cov31-Tisochrysis_lutea.AAC.7
MLLGSGTAGGTNGVGAAAAAGTTAGTGGGNCCCWTRASARAWAAAARASSLTVSAWSASSNSVLSYARAAPSEVTVLCRASSRSDASAQKSRPCKSCASRSSNDFTARNSLWKKASRSGREGSEVRAVVNVSLAVRSAERSSASNSADSRMREAKGSYLQGECGPQLTKTHPSIS